MTFQTLIVGLISAATVALFVMYNQGNAAAHPCVYQTAACVDINDR